MCRLAAGMFGLKLVWAVVTEVFGKFICCLKFITLILQPKVIPAYERALMIDRLGHLIIQLFLLFNTLGHLFLCSFLLCQEKTSLFSVHTNYIFLH